MKFWCEGAGCREESETNPTVRQRDDWLGWFCDACYKPGLNYVCIGCGVYHDDNSSVMKRDDGLFRCSDCERERLMRVVSSPLSKQVGGEHYKKYAIQPIEFCMKNGLDACQSAAIGYIVRFRDKGGIADLDKAIHTLELLKQFEQEKAK